MREDYSHDGDAWSHFPHEHARSRTYRWGEDGIAGVSDNHQFECVSFGFWNEKDDILKERLFGLAGPLGNHGEDGKESYFYVDNTPSHSYMKYLYKYPQKKYPYEQLVQESTNRSREDYEFELEDTGVFDENRYFDIFIEMAKDGENSEELLFRVTAYNRGPESAPLHIIPQVWFRNTWDWGIPEEKDHPKPQLAKQGRYLVRSDHWRLGERYVEYSQSPGVGEKGKDVDPELMFTENSTNKKRLYGVQNDHEFCKDGFHDHIIDGSPDTVNPRHKGTKSGAWYAFDEQGGIPPGDFVTVRFKFTNQPPEEDYDVDECVFDEGKFDWVMDRRQDEADEFYFQISPLPMTDELRDIQRQALSGMLWNKQFYHFIHDQWLKGDPAQPPPPPDRKNVRNENWQHLHTDDILSMPDKWEYPFFASWDSAFHCIPLAMVDPDFGKRQLDLLTREWYMHPNGQIPAYEWNFSDVNPPVHAWATFRVFKLERRMYGREDLDFLERVFQKLLLNFTWWVNRKDTEGKNIFEGGFLGLDNIGLFNRSEPLPTGGTLEQADSTGWMAFFSLQMLNIALELSKTRPVYEDIASKFFEHFLFIADAMGFRNIDGVDKALWNDEDGFYYDSISWGGANTKELPVRSLVGLIPLYAVLTLEPSILNRFQSFSKRLKWFVEHRTDITERNIASMTSRGREDRLLLALVNQDRLKKILHHMLNEDEFLSDFGIRSLSKYHNDHPYSMDVNGQHFEIGYTPGESKSGLFGGNSNWRGPIWFPVNFLLIESLQRFYMYYGDEFKVECPTGSGTMMNLAEVAEFIQHRLIKIFQEEDNEKSNGRPYTGSRDPNINSDLNNGAYFHDYILFHEYFHGDTGRGLGSQHQCGWTGLVAKLIHDVGVSCSMGTASGGPKTPVSTAEHYFDDEIKDSTTKRRHHRRRSSTKLPRRFSEKHHDTGGYKNEQQNKNEDEEEDEDLSEEIRKALENQKINGFYKADEELETKCDS